MSTVGGSRNVLCKVQRETTACNGFASPAGKPAGTITRKWIEAMRAGHSVYLAVLGVDG
jgi:hypothetical protein